MTHRGRRFFLVNWLKKGPYIRSHLVGGAKNGSGTHGVEGFCGSGCQTGYLNDRLYEALSSKSAVILVHALNPFGFAWLRRVNEDNIDVNRNFHDFRKPLPSSEAYEQLHGWLVPGDWTGPQREKADAALLGIRRSKKRFSHSPSRN